MDEIPFEELLEYLRVKAAAFGWCGEFERVFSRLVPTVYAVDAHGCGCSMCRGDGVGGFIPLRGAPETISRTVLSAAVLAAWKRRAYYADGDIELGVEIERLLADLSAKFNLAGLPEEVQS